MSEDDYSHYPVIGAIVVLNLKIFCNLAIGSIVIKLF